MRTLMFTYTCHVMTTLSLVLLRFRKLESFRTLRKLLRSRRLLTRSLEPKLELP
jgi:hypothetical protein